MGRKNRKSKRTRRRPSRLRRWWAEMDAGHRRVVKVAAAWTVALSLVTVGGAWGLKRLEAYVLASSARRPPELGVRLVGRPDWLPRATLERIAADLLGDGADYYDRGLTRRVNRNAQSEPWIRSVERVSKYRSSASDLAVVELRATYRRPVARAGADGRYHLVDAEGVRLPPWEAPQWVAAAPEDAPREGEEYFADLARVPSGWDARRLHYIVVELSAEFDPPPPPVGRAWNCEALSAGLRLVRRVLDEPYATEVTKVDARNFEGRQMPNQPELVMYAQRGRSRPTKILFGRFPLSGGDYVVAPKRKFAYLDSYYAGHGRLAGLAGGLDLRHDQLLTIPY